MSSRQRFSNDAPPARPAPSSRTSQRESTSSDPFNDDDCDATRSPLPEASPDMECDAASHEDASFKAGDDSPNGSPRLSR
ncbi:hypothetical protein MTO96_022431 [Rhipicephalus appendiculatus]